MNQTPVTTALNVLLSNTHVLIAKLHNFHWNVSGMEFHPIHNATEAYYDHFFTVFDDIAERVLQLEAKPIATVKGYLETATLTETEATKFTGAEVLDAILTDFTTLLGQSKELETMASDAGDIATSDLLTGIISYLEKEIWLIKSSLGK